MKGFNDHPVKKVIREQWCLPLITHLCEKLGCKLTYLGLPGIEAIDILTWKDYLKKVIAFDIGDYSKPYNEEKAKENISKLYQKLSELETNGTIEDFSLFHGYIEEVVLKGIDRDRSTFSLNEKITIYNLDFCNPLTVPLDVTDPFTGEVNTFYKTEVIRKLLEIQRDQSKENNNTKFIFYITVHSLFWKTEAEKLFSGDNIELFNKYSESLSELDEQNRNVRLLRLYMIDIIKTQFCSNQFIPEFLPTLYYNGTKDNWLLCFTVIGTYIKSAACKAPFYQDTEALITEKFLQPNDKGITHLIQSSIKETNCMLDSIKAIQELKSYKEKWLN